MANELINDGKYIYINTESAEAYIPNDTFDRPEDSPSQSSIAYDTGTEVISIGIFYMRFFDTEDVTEADRKKSPLRTLVYPNKIECKPTGDSTIEKLNLDGDVVQYRVLHFNKGDILMESESKQASTNVELFTKLVMNGHLPKSLSYEDLYFSWRKCFNINGVDPKIPNVLMQAAVAIMCRDKRNPKVQFRMVAGKDSKADRQNGFRMLNMNQVSANSSVSAAMSFERLSEKLTSALIMSKEGLPQEESPIDSLITI